MKGKMFWNYRIFLLMAVGVTLFFTACSEDDAPEVHGASIKLNVKLAKEFEKAKNQKVAVTLRNTSTREETVVETTLNKDTVLANLPVDMYDVIAAYTLSTEEIKALTGREADGDIAFSAAATGIQLSPGKETGIDLELTAGGTDDFVFKTIYYAGSDNKKAAGEDDCFIEIYNNTNRTLYADSLCFALTTMNRYGLRNNGKWHEYAQPQKFYFTPKGTYDWSKAEGMADPEGANDKYVYGNIVLMVPGNGKTYPIKPGQSFIIAPFALNFKEPYTTVNGKEVKPEWPDSTLNLSNAEFDVVYPGNEELDNKNADNMVILHKGNNRYMRLSRNGKEGYVLFRHPNPSELPLYLRPYRNMKYADPSQFMQIPVAGIIDAVEVINPNADGYVSPKAFPKQLDASYAYSKPDYSFRCITRKVSRTADGRRILQDLNNSALDFVEMIPNPKAFAPSR